MNPHETKNALSNADNLPQAWVIFSGQADMTWLKILKPGFRHCALLLNDGRHWVTLDPLANTMEICVHQLPADFDLPAWMQSRGHTVTPAKIQRILRPAPWAFLTCVGVVKRALGLRRRFIFTPWQLYRHLNAPQDAHQFNPKGDILWEA